MSSNLETGKKGELIAVDYLKNNGFTVLFHHYTCHWGELDIIAKKDKKLCFIEVKTRTTTTKGKPYEAVTFYKKQSLMRAVQYFLKEHPEYREYKYSLDVIAISVNRSSLQTDKIINYFQNIL